MAKLLAMCLFLLILIPMVSCEVLPEEGTQYGLSQSNQKNAPVSAQGGARGRSTTSRACSSARSAAGSACASLQVSTGTSRSALATTTGRPREGGRSALKYDTGNGEAAVVILGFFVSALTISDLA
ncbi:hypothetical protein Cni_G05465 [Canna indica]|uniref:Uncharacterized protein n=1 Tax=Canna indica TaxID=4628 RepID=A0AAQ3Q3S6_9LILI|nr:hypothetical protein Cni_G05465 [Canna indica]